jgi:hypothetical protein
VVSPNCLTGNAWDLEAFLLDGTNLSVVGSYNLKNGYDGTVLGDIFIDLNGDASNYGLTGGTNSGANTLHTFANSLTDWDYAIKLDYTNSTFKAYKLTDGSILTTEQYQNWYLNANGNPVSLRVVGESVAASGAFSYSTGLADNASLGYTGWGSGTTSHNKITLDIAGILHSHVNNLTTHVALSCGNDVLTGKATIDVPEPASISMLLIGLGLLGTRLIRRRGK